MGIRAFDDGRARWMRFEAGFRLLFEGVGFLRREPSLWPWVLMPVLLALVCVAIASSLLLEHLGAIVAWCASLLPVFEAGEGWRRLGFAAATFLVWIAGGLLALAVLGGVLVAALLAAYYASVPWLAQLSFRVEALERMRRGDARSADSATSGLLRAVRSALAAGLRAGLLAAVGGGLFFVGLVVPGAAAFCAPLFVLFALFSLPFEGLSLAFDRRRMGWFARLHFLIAHSATLAGLGSSVFVVGLVPGFNLLVMPALVTAGTLFVLRLEANEDESVGGDLASFSESQR